MSSQPEKRSDDSSADYSDSQPSKSPTLREVEQHFAELVAGVEDHAIFLLNPDGIVISWNAGAERIKGYKPHEIIGRHFSNFYTQPAIDTQWPQEELKRAAEVGRFQDEGWRVRKNGTQLWANVVITALRSADGKLQGFLKITRDLTERRQAEEVLRQSEERFRLMVSSVQDYAIFMLDPEGRIASWNLGAERIKGYKSSEAIGQHFSIFFSSEDVMAGKPDNELVTAMREGRVEYTGWRVRKDRSQFWANVVITALYDDQRKLRGFAKITRDLTNSRQVEQLQLADKQKNEFLAMLAHELRNPLAPIRNGVEILKMSSSLEPDILETTKMMERQIVHLVRLVDDLLDVSRIITGKIHLEKGPVTVDMFLDRAIEEIQPLIDERGHELMVSRPARPIFVEGDVVRLSQVVSNLLGNAAKYTDKSSQIWLSIESEDENVAIKVRDKGIGMTADELSRIFNLFEQGDTSLSRSRGGLGIGLTLVKRIVALHGGTVTATSAGPTLGSEFTVRLPLAASTGSSMKNDASIKRAPSQNSRRILVVDDNVDAALSVERLLKHWGHSVACAFNGPDAIEKAKAFRPQFVLLDIGMPGMSGYEVAEQLRANPEFQGLIITALTGYGQAEDRRRSLAAGFNFHLIKPPNPAELEALISSPATYAGGLQS